MTDEARIERLTQLARRVWPDADIQPNYGTNNKLRGYGVKATGAAYSDGITAWHPRSLDALEAALLVLAGDEWTIEAAYSRVETAHGHLPAWVEALASHWQIAGEGLLSLGHEDTGDAYLDCARELRERARKP